MSKVEKIGRNKKSSTTSDLPFEKCVGKGSGVQGQVRRREWKIHTIPELPFWSEVENRVQVDEGRSRCLCFHPVPVTLHRYPVYPRPSR